MRIYLSGPVTGQEDTAACRFGRAILDASYLAWDMDIPFASVEIINPYEVNCAMAYHCEPSHSDYMAVSLALLSLCDTVFLMRGWELSLGCCAEYEYAKSRNYQIFYQDDVKREETAK